jgi:hypothetical protein
MTTPAEKAAATRKRNKAYATYEASMAPFDAAYYGFAETLYPERNAKFAAAEAKLEQAKSQYIKEWEEIMAEFDKAMEPHDAIRDAARKEAWAIYSDEKSA